MLGTFLFEIFINDILYFIHYASRILYTYDLNIFINNSDPEICQDDLNGVSEWFIENIFLQNEYKLRAYYRKITLLQHNYVIGIKLTNLEVIFNTKLRLKHIFVFILLKNTFYRNKNCLLTHVCICCN